MFVTKCLSYGKSSISLKLSKNTCNVLHNKFCKKILFCTSHSTGTYRRVLHNIAARRSLSSVAVNVKKDSDNNVESEKVNKFTTRSFNCGELRAEHLGTNVVLKGWLEFQRMNRFIVLRDAYGQTQLIVPDDQAKLKELVQSLPYESVLSVEGTVSLRPKDMINRKQKTGEIEVVVKNMCVLNKAKVALPFGIREFQKAKESLRMQYRYLDFRFAEMQTHFRLRSEVLMNMRRFLVDECGFVDVETPTLFGATPGGAQEFVVPTRFPGQFYSLVQSPQQFKQLLMIGGIDRYFQIARCYRDESARSDRQPEFTQLDLEMSFTNVDGVLTLIEELMQYCWPKRLGGVTIPFQRITYADAMEQYGSDKPDLRYDFKLRNCTEALKSHSNDLVNVDTFAGHYLIFPGGDFMNIFTKSVKESFGSLAKKSPGVKFLQSKVKSKNRWIDGVKNLIGENLATSLAEFMDLKEDDVMFLCYGDKQQALQLLGNVRLQFIDLVEKSGHKLKKCDYVFNWVTDFPLLERNELGQIVTVHHPFTAPMESDLHLLSSDPLKVKSQAYDLVLNGNEIGGGSIRVHDPEMQKKIFNILKIKPESMKYFLDALESGCPPHGGIALGLDRLMAVMLNCKSIRDVIAFPKGFEGRDPLSGAPLPISDADKALYHLNVANAKK